MSDPVRQSGLFASLNRLLGTVLEIAQVRLDLVGTEVELEKRRIFDGLLWGAGAMMFLGIGLVMLCGFIVLLFWDGYRLAAVGAMALVFLLASAALVREARRRLSQPNGMFETSLAELERDRAGLQSPQPHEQ